MRLIRVELHRFRARRAIALMLLGVTLLVTWMTLDTIWQTRPVSDSEIAVARQQAAQDEQFLREEYDRCAEDPASYVGFPEATADDCPPAESDYRWYLSRSPLSLEEELRDTGKAAVVVLAGIAVIIGATFAGADWATGSLGNQLIFRPRRLQVWAAKAVAVAVGTVVLAALVIAAQWGAYLAVSELRDVGHAPGTVSDIVTTSLRGLALVAGGAVGGLALTMLLRSTVGTLAVLFFYTVAGEALVAIFPVQKVSQWSPSNNVFAWLDDGIEVYDETITCGPRDMMCSSTYQLSLTHGAWYLGVLLLLTVAVSIVLFQRRDVP
ncbi:MAG TPA: hypothetical protein VFK52_10365 [Nocardioidaceae bacterium]|nr:hypothetical protein [Nocardioidaceae bacterium]